MVNHLLLNTYKSPMSSVCWDVILRSICCDVTSLTQYAMLCYTTNIQLCLALQESSLFMWTEKTLARLCLFNTFASQHLKKPIHKCQACFNASWILRVYGFNTRYLQIIQPITVKLYRILLIYITFIWTNNKKDCHVTFGGHFGSHIENMKNAYKQLFYAKNI